MNGRTSWASCCSTANRRKAVLIVNIFKQLYAQKSMSAVGKRQTHTCQIGNTNGKLPSALPAIIAAKWFIVLIKLYG